MGMKFELDDKAKKWIESRGKYLTVKTVDVKGCCVVGGIQELLAVPKRPKDPDHYNVYKIESLSIYIQKNINEKDKIILKMSGFGPLKSISAKGVQQ